MQTPSQLVDAYQALIAIVDEVPIQSGTSQTVKERIYAGQYLDETPNSADSITIRKRILSGSRRYLEEQYVN